MPRVVYEKLNGWQRLCAILLTPLTRMLSRRRYFGAERFAGTGAALLVANHISHLDPVFDVIYVRSAGRVPHVLAKASLWKIPILGRIVAGSDQIPVERGGGAGQAALEPAIQALRDGKVVVIYPEGTVTKDPDRWPMRPRPGVAALALSGDFPVIPVVHWGTQEIYDSYTSGRKFHPWPRKRVQVIAGDPIDLSPYRGKPVDARAIRDVSYLIMGTIRDMLAEVRGEPAPDSFFDPKKAERQQRASGDAAVAGPVGGSVSGSVAGSVADGPSDAVEDAGDAVGDAVSDPADGAGRDGGPPS